MRCNICGEKTSAVQGCFLANGKVLCADCYEIETLDLIHYKEKREDLYKEIADFKFRKSNIFSEISHRLHMGLNYFWIVHERCNSEMKRFLYEIMLDYKQLNDFVEANKDKSRELFIKEMKEEIFGGNFYKYRYFRGNSKTVRRNKKFKNFSKL